MIRIGLVIIALWILVTALSLNREGAIERRTSLQFRFALGFAASSIVLWLAVVAMLYWIIFWKFGPWEPAGMDFADLILSIASGVFFCISPVRFKAMLAFCAALMALLQFLTFVFSLIRRDF